jgi:hypothetical protein
VRALIGAFATANQTQFNRADGAGYDFLAEVVIRDIDGTNPQVAARLATAFRSWRALEAGRRGKARAALERVAAVGTLSADVRDIVARSLVEGAYPHGAVQRAGRFRLRGANGRTHSGFAGEPGRAPARGVDAPRPPARPARADPPRAGDDRGDDRLGGGRRDVQCE